MRSRPVSCSQPTHATSPPSRPPFTTRDAHPPAADASGALDPFALGRDAFDGKLCALSDAHTLARRYEAELASRDSRIAQLEREQRQQTRAPTNTEATPANAGTTEQAAASALKRQKKTAATEGRTSRFKRLRSAFSLIYAARMLLGGPAELTKLFVGLLQGSFRGKKDVLEDPIDAICDNACVRKKIEKALSKRQRPRIARFRFAKIQRLTYAGMDRLRFAMPWCPGHATMAKDLREYETHLERCWIPSGPEAGAEGLTALSEEEQAAAAAEDAAAVDEEPEEAQAEAEAAARDAAKQGGVGTLDSAADDFEEQGLGLLALEFPKETREELVARWSRGGDATGLYKDARVVHALAVDGAGKLLGFIKALVLPREVFVEEVLVAEAARGKRLAQHLFVQLTEACPTIRFTRLQVSTAPEKEAARKVYSGIAYLQKRPKGAPWEEALDGCIMMGATRAAVNRAAIAATAERPLEEGMVTRVCWAGEGAEQRASSEEADDERSEQEVQDERAEAEAEAERAADAAEAGTAAAEQLGSDHACDDREMREDDVEDAQMDPSTPPAPSWGARALSDALAMLLVALWLHNVVLTGSAAQSFGFKITCDAATLMNAPRAWRCVTTVIAQLLTAGVTPDDWSGAVQHMLPKVHSCLRCFPLRTWFGKDSRVNVRRPALERHTPAALHSSGTRRVPTHTCPSTQILAHLAPIMREAMEIEREGLVVDLLQERAPWGYNVGQKGWKRKVEIRKQRKGVQDTGMAHVREILTTGVKMKATVMFSFDGATTIAGSGQSFAEGDLFTHTAREKMDEFLRVVPIKRHEGWAEVAERLAPGCKAESHKMHYLIEYLPFCNRHAANSELQLMTAEPERMPEPDQVAGVGKLSKAEQKALFGDGASDGRTAPKLQPYKDAAVRAARYNHAAFVPVMNGNNPDAKATKDGLIRVPIVTKPFERDLPKAIWAWSKEQNISARLGLCIIHCGMRTMESNLREMLTLLEERFLAKKSDAETINTFLNKQVWADLSLRKLISCDQHGKVNKVSLSGGEVRSLIADLRGDDSLLLRALRTTYSKLSSPVDELASHLSEWEKVLKHWATAMHAAYTSRATPEDRITFRKHAQYYVVAKKTVAQKLVWYDWQIFSIMPFLFDRYESLMMISQEGMEAVQKQNNALQRNGFNYANVGRYPKAVIAQGLDAIKAYLAERLKKMKSPAHWLWSKQVLQFMSTFHEIFERVERYRAEGHTITWDEFEKEWAYYMVSARFACRLAGRWRVWRRGGRGHCGQVGTGYGAELLGRHRAYYAPCACEVDPTFWKLRPEDAAKRLQKERKARWAAGLNAMHAASIGFDRV